MPQTCRYFGQPTVFTPLIDGGNGFWVRVAVIAGGCIGGKAGFGLVFITEMGLSMRATGSNLRMAQAQGINTPWIIILGMAISNGFDCTIGCFVCADPRIC